MEHGTAINTRELRANADLLQHGGWVAYEAEGGYLVLCDGVVLHAINSKKPRIFRSLDTVLKSLRKMGVKEFEVSTEKFPA